MGVVNILVVTVLSFVSNSYYSSVMAGLVGKLEEFDDGQDWLEFVERLEQYFEANSIGDEKKWAILLTVCGSKTYSLIRHTVAPQKPKDKSYE